MYSYDHKRHKLLAKDFLYKKTDIHMKSTIWHGSKARKINPMEIPMRGNVAVQCIYHYAKILVECRVDVAVAMLHDFEKPLCLCLVLQLQPVNYLRYGVSRYMCNN